MVVANANANFPLNNQCNGTMAIAKAAVDISVDFWCGGTPGGCCGLCYNVRPSWNCFETGEEFPECDVELTPNDGLCRRRYRGTGSSYGCAAL